jgi:hypothetical protein
MTVNVTQPSSGGTGTGSGNADVISIALVPASQSVETTGETAQFIAIGTTSTGVTVNLSGRVSWTSSSSQIATINAAGLATAASQGTVTITALYTNADGTAATGTGSFTVIGGNSEPFTAITLIPGSESLSSTQTGQFIALATSGTTGLTEDVTNAANVKWTSSVPSIATVTTYPASPAGLAQGVSTGSSTITATLTNPDNTVLTATSSVSVSSTLAPEPLLSLTIIPSTITVGNLQDTGQFLAIGTYSTEPNVRDLTNSVTWISSAPSVFPVNTNGTGTPIPGAPAGVVTAYGTGGAVVIAEATDPTTQSIQTATAEFNCPLVLPTPTSAGSCYNTAAALLATLTVYNEGLDTTNWLVTAPSATGTPDVLHCGPGSATAGFGGSVCVATYPVGTTVTLTAPAGTGNFGGWSYNCTAQGNITAAGPNSCTVTLTTNDTVGAIFN